MLAVLACLLGPAAATPLATYKVEAWEREDLGASDDSSRLCEARSAKPCVLFLCFAGSLPSPRRLFHRGPGAKRQRGSEGVGRDVV